MLQSTSARDIARAIANDVGGIVADDRGAELALQALDMGIKTRTRFPPHDLELTRCDAEMIALRSRGLTWVEIAESIGYCERQVRRIFKALASRLHCTEEELLGLAQIIDLHEMQW